MDVALNASVNRTYIAPNQKTILYLELTIQRLVSGNKKESFTPLPKNIGFLIDKSGSMSGEKIKKAKTAAKDLIDRVKKGDNVSIMTFSDSYSLVDTINIKTKSDKNKIKQKVDTISISGGTNMYNGIKNSGDQLKRKNIENVRSLILLTDGQPTDGKSEKQYTELARNLRENGITIYCIGIGNYNEEFLASIGENSGGKWFHLKNMNKLLPIINTTLQRIEATTHTAPKLNLRPINKVTIKKENNEYEIYKAEPNLHKVTNIAYSSGSNEYSFPISDIRINENQKYFTTLEVEPLQGEGERRIVNIRLTGTNLDISTEVKIFLSDERDKLITETNPEARQLAIITSTRSTIRDGTEKQKTIARKKLTAIEKEPTASNKIKTFAETTKKLDSKAAKSKDSEKLKEIKYRLSEFDKG